MEYRIETLSQKTLVGVSVRMSLVNNKTQEVWQRFQSNKSSITNAKGTDLYSLQVYDSVDYFKSFNPETEFTKWAAIEVENLDNIPNSFYSKILPTGLYAVFTHRGNFGQFQKTIQYIFGEWLPNSDFRLDDRPHFELLGDKYKNNTIDSEEEVYIPITPKI